jgi:sugar porter (SP) family MFS transporter
MNTATSKSPGFQENKTHPVNPRLILWAIVSALAGFLFGFDTVVISGAEKTIQQVWNLSPSLHGLAVGAALWGTVLGALIGSWPTDYFGRKKTLLSIGLLFLVGSLGSSLASGVNLFMIARFLGGIAIGVSTVAAPLYISEISPAHSRGRLAGMFQFNIVFGILVAFASNYLMARIVHQDSWRWMLGIMAFPSVIYTLACLFIPESPRWLLSRKGDYAAGLAVLKLINPSATDKEIGSIADDIVKSGAREAASTTGFWHSGLSVPIMIAFLIAFFNQLSGINAVLYFAPRIFELTGLGEKAALLQSVGIGVTNLVFTFIGLWLIDKLGRRTLLFIGSFGYIASLGLCSWAFFTQHFAIVPFCIFSFIAAHAIGQGTVIWVLISEIFPNKFRAMGQSLGCSTHWIFAALITTLFPVAVSRVSPGTIFLFFCFMMVLQLLWVKFMVTETKGRTLEQIQSDLGIS